MAVRPLSSLSWFAGWLAGLIWHLVAQRSRRATLCPSLPRGTTLQIGQRKFNARVLLRTGRHWQHPGICRHRRHWIWRCLPFSRHIGQVPVCTPTTGVPHWGISGTWSGHEGLLILPTDFALNESEIKSSGICVFSADRTGSMTSHGIVRIDWWYFLDDVKCSFSGSNLHVSIFQWKLDKYPRKRG